MRKMIHKLGHHIGVRGAVDGGLQLPLTTVLETKDGDMEHKTIGVTKRVFRLLHSRAQHRKHTQQGKVWCYPCTMCEWHVGSSVGPCGTASPSPSSTVARRRLGRCRCSRPREVRPIHPARGRSGPDLGKATPICHGSSTHGAWCRRRKSGTGCPSSMST